MVKCIKIPEESRIKIIYMLLTQGPQTVKVQIAFLFYLPKIMRNEFISNQKINVNIFIFI